MSFSFQSFLIAGTIPVGELTDSLRLVASLLDCNCLGLDYCIFLVQCNRTCHSIVNHPIHHNLVILKANQFGYCKFLCHTLLYSVICCTSNTEFRPDDDVRMNITTLIR